MAHRELHLNSSCFFHTALDSTMDGLFICSTPNLEPQHASSTKSKTQSVLASAEERYYTVCNTWRQRSESLDSVHDSETGKDDKGEIQNPTSTLTPKHVAVATQSPPSTETFTPRRTVAAARKQKLFAETEMQEEFQLKTRFPSNKVAATAQEQQLRKAMMRMECLQRRQERMTLSKKPLRTSLRI